MPTRTTRTSLAALLLLSATAAGARPVDFDLDPLELLLLDDGTSTASVFLSGSLSVDTEDFDAFGAGAPFPFLLPTAFDMALGLRLDDGVGPTTYSIPVDPTTATLALSTAGVRIDGTAVVLDAGALAPGSPLADLTIDRLPETITFPNGRRAGDEDGDLLVAQLFSGSVSFGLAAFTEGPLAPPGFSAAVRITEDDRYVLARPASAVPEPAPLALAGLAGILLLRRVQRRAQRRAQRS